MKKDELKVGEVYSLGTPSNQHHIGKLISTEVYEPVFATASYQTNITGYKPSEYKAGEKLGRYNGTQTGYPVLVINNNDGEEKDPGEALARFDASQVDPTSREEVLITEHLTGRVFLYASREFRCTMAEQREREKVARRQVEERRHQDIEESRRCVELRDTLTKLLPGVRIRILSSSAVAIYDPAKLIEALREVRG